MEENNTPEETAAAAPPETDEKSKEELPNGEELPKRRRRKPATLPGITKRRRRDDAQSSSKQTAPGEASDGGAETDTGTAAPSRRSARLRSIVTSAAVVDHHSSDDSKSESSGGGGANAAMGIEEGSDDEDDDREGNENDSACFECGGGGELFCCDGCTRAYHQECLNTNNRPTIHMAEWWCPFCLSSPAAILCAKRGVRFPFTAPQESNPASPSASPSASAITVPVKNVDVPAESIVSSDTTTEPSGRTPTESNASVSRTRRDEPKKKATPSRIFSAGKCRVSAIMASDRRQLEGRTGDAAPVSRGASDDGPSAKLNVGPLHQAPFITQYFLEAQENGMVYSLTDDPTVPLGASLGTSRLQRGLSECKLMFSPSLWAAALGHCPPRETPAADKDEKAGVEDSARPADEVDESVGPKLIATPHELVEFIKKCEDDWPTSCPWPFSIEWPFKLLHYTNFDANLAIAILKERHFSLKDICDLPCRPYMNKWRPKDRRGMIPSTPFPNPTLTNSRPRRIGGPSP